MYRHEVTLTPLGWKWKTLIAVLCLAVGGFVLSLFVYRADHHDYKPAECRSGDFLVKADLIGTYERLGNDRRAPYYLRMRVFLLGQSDPSVISVSGLRLTTSESHIDIPDASLSQSDGTDVDLGAHIVVADDLDVDFVRYTLLGNLRDARSGAEGRVICEMQRHRHTEWSIPILDALMSV